MIPLVVQKVADVEDKLVVAPGDGKRQRRRLWSGRLFKNGFSTVK